LIRFTLFSKNPSFLDEKRVVLEPTRPPYHLEGGGDGTRTHDRLVANQVLYQLSYAPSCWWWA
jgi:hypothetical protein